MQRKIRAVLGFVAGASLLTPTIAAAQRSRDALVSGVVRDSLGRLQVGTSIRLIANDLRTISVTSTDVHGHYMLSVSRPGEYSVSATVAMLASSALRTIQLRPGRHTIANLTLQTAFDQGPLFPAIRRTPDEPSDDWLWTLRSQASRPILRAVAADQQQAEVGDGKAKSARSRQTVSSEISVGGFARSGRRQSVTREALTEDSLSTMGLELAAVPTTASRADLTAHVFADVLRLGKAGTESRSIISLESHPEISAAARNPGLLSMRAATAHRTNFGDFAGIEVGSSLDYERLTDSSFRANPFINIDVHPFPQWKVVSRFATSEDAQSYDDLGVVRTRVAPVAMSGNHLRQAHRRHAQISVERGAGRQRIRVAYYHDAAGTTIVSGLARLPDRPSGMQAALPVGPGELLSTLR